MVGLWDCRMTVAELDTKRRGRAKQWSNRAGLPRFFGARNPVPNSVKLSLRGLPFGTRKRPRFRDRISDRPSPIPPLMPANLESGIRNQLALVMGCGGVGWVGGGAGGVGCSGVARWDGLSRGWVGWMW